MLHAFKRSKQGKSVIPWILIALLVFVIVGVSIFGWDLEGFGKGLTTGMEVTLTYKDGTTKTIKGDSKNTLFPITIFDAGIPVTQITVNVFGTLNFDGTVTNWIFDGDFNVNMFQKIGDTSYLLIGLMYSDNLGGMKGTTWTNLETKTLKTFTLQDTDIEAYIDALGKPVGDYKLKYSLPVDSFSVTFDDGNTDVIDPPTVVTEWFFTYDYSSGLTSLTLQISTEP